MTRIDKKILENIEILSKAMVKNGLSEVKFSDGNISYELKKPVDGQSLKNISLPEQPPKQEKETSSSEKALKSPLVGTAYLSPEPQAKTFVEIGPGKVLSGLIKRINKDVKIYTINSIDDIKDLKNVWFKK